jgi:hypothetical protein
MLRTASTLAAAALLSACSNTSYDALYLAEQGDLAAALDTATGVQSFTGGLLRGAGFSCRDHQLIINLHVARADFDAAAEVCEGYRDDCAINPENGLCFSFDLDELQRAQNDTGLADSVTSQARENLHFRWLMIRDDYEGKAFRRPIY